MCLCKHIHVYSFVHMYACLYAPTCFWMIVHVCSNVCTCVGEWLHMCIYLYLSVHAYMFVSSHMILCVSAHMCTHAFMYLCVFLCAHVLVCLCIYIHARTCICVHALVWELDGEGQLTTCCVSHPTACREDLRAGQGLWHRREGAAQLPAGDRMT